MNRIPLIALALFAILASLPGCFTTAPRETLAGFRLELPASASERQVLTLTVTALGSDGSDPLRRYAGEVRLTASRGSVTPDRILLDGGSAATEVVLRGALGEVAVTARGGGASGSTSIELVVLTALPGDPQEPAADAIPEIKFEPREQDYRNDHPHLAGVQISFNTLLAAFDRNATVAEVNAVLESVEAEIVAGLPGRGGEVPGIVFLRVPTSSHPEMIALLAELRADPRVAHVVQDSLLVHPDPTAESEPELYLVSGSGPGTLPNWRWELEPGGTNWHLERIRVPQMWNLNAATEKAGGSVVVGVLDAGFAASHEDLAYAANLTPEEEDDHGTHVAGTIGAAFDNGEGIDGVNPFARLVVAVNDLLADLPVAPGSVLGSDESAGREMIEGLMALLDERPDIQVVNISLGYDWEGAGVDTSLALSPSANAARFLAAEQGAILAIRLAIEALATPLPLIVVAAGNESDVFPDGSGGYALQSAAYASPYASAALLHDRDEILVVESVANAQGSAGGATRSDFSNPGGHLSAPGTTIWSTSHPLAYESKSGTSMAAPQVTGLASYLLTVDPTLTRAELRELLLANAVAVDPGVPADDRVSPRIDAFAAAMDIDRVQNSDRVLRMLVDVDDGTADGNQRTEPGSSVDTTDEDADQDGGEGDGTVDMSDFRRFRDWLLQVEADTTLALDGSASHPKKDLNGDGITGPPSEENIYPRGDFNGDGILSRSGESRVPGAIGEEVTDLGVLMVAFDDPNYDASDLPELLDSGDISIDLTACFAIPGADTVRTSVRAPDSGPVIEEFEHHQTDRFVHTVLASPDGYVARVEVRDSAGETLSVHSIDLDPSVLGGDLGWRPPCVPAVIEVVFPEVVEPSTPTPLQVRTGVRLADGSVEYQEDWRVDLQVQGGAASPTDGFTDADGFFAATITSAASSETVTLFVTVFDLDGAEVGSQIAQANVAPGSAAGEIDLTGAEGDFFAYADVFVDNTIVDAVCTPSCDDVVGDPRQPGGFEDSFENTAVGSIGSSRIRVEHETEVTVSGGAVEVTFDGRVEWDVQVSTAEAGSGGSVSGETEFCLDFEVSGGYADFELAADLPAGSYLRFAGGHGEGRVSILHNQDDPAATLPPTSGTLGHYDAADAEFDVEEYDLCASLNLSGGSWRNLDGSVYSLPTVDRRISLTLSLTPRTTP